MKSILSLLILSVGMLVAFLVPQHVYAQDRYDDSLHVRTYSWDVRVPWFNGVATARIVKSDTAAASDTLSVPGITSTTKVWYSRLRPAKKAAAEPTITVGTDKIIIAFGVADTVTYHLLIDKKSN